jgi:hypothetical protein
MSESRAKTTRMEAQTVRYAVKARGMENMRRKGKYMADVMMEGMASVYQPCRTYSSKAGNTALIGKICGVAFTCYSNALLDPMLMRLSRTMRTGQPSQLKVLKMV